MLSILKSTTRHSIIANAVNLRKSCCSVLVRKANISGCPDYLGFLSRKDESQVTSLRNKAIRRIFIRLCVIRKFNVTLSFR
jgi:hypothetical protein